MSGKPQHASLLKGVSYLVYNPDLMCLQMETPGSLGEFIETSMRLSCVPSNPPQTL